MTATTYAAYPAPTRSRTRSAEQKRRERERQLERWSAYGLDAIFADREVTFVGYLSGLACDEIDDCLDFTGGRLPGDHVRMMVMDGSAPYGLVIQCKRGLFVVTGKRLEPLPEGVKWVSKTC